MTIPDIALHRLHSQRLTGHKFQTPADAVTHFGAVQAQDYLYSLWALGLRVEGATEAFVEQAVADRHIVRTWPLRSTIHYVTAADIRWMLKLTEAHTVSAAARRLRQLELDDAVFAQSRKALIRALDGGRLLIRREVFEAIESAGVSTAGQRGYFMLWRHALEGLVCIGPRQGKQQTFVLLEDWLPLGKEFARDEALAELALRYFTGHGPASVKDYIWWSGLPAAEARAGLESVKAKLEKAIIDKEEFWFATHEPVSKVASTTAHLLPFVDEYLIGYRDRGAVINPEYHALVDSGNVIFNAPVIIDGQVAGIWKRSFKRGKVIISATLFRPLSATENDALADAVTGLGHFLGLSAELDRLS